MHTTESEVVPEPVDMYTRNRRVYEYLKSLGLVVHPIYVDGDPHRLDQMVVSTHHLSGVELLTREQWEELQASDS